MLLVFLALFLIFAFIYYRRRIGENAKNGTKKETKTEGKVILSAALEILFKRFKFNLNHTNQITIAISKANLNDLTQTDVDLLYEIDRNTKVYFLLKIHHLDEEVPLKSLIIERIPFIKPKIHHVLFHQTHKGKIAFVRQIRPHLHIDCDALSVKELAPHVPFAVRLLNEGDVLKKSGEIVAIRRIEDLIS
mmetsp:Transcript_3177/g.3439  ORF Transcript_3177/g.3439 Transcript_3177/m.3439 type:complete len:191 (-) Transcript_3177:1710-2282(-)